MKKEKDDTQYVGKVKEYAEAIAMSIFEYDEEKHLKNEREYAYRKGREEILQKLQEFYSLTKEEAKACYYETENSMAES